MEWKGEGRRDEDLGKESMRVIMARIDERVKNLDSHNIDFKKDFGDYKDAFQRHMEEDKKNFNKLFSWRNYILGIGGAVGGMLTCATLIILWIKR